MPNHHATSIHASTPRQALRNLFRRTLSSLSRMSPLTGSPRTRKPAGLGLVGTVCLARVRNELAFLLRFSYRGAAWHMSGGARADGVTWETIVKLFVSREPRAWGGVGAK